MLVRPTVALAGEIKPFWVTKFIAHEGEVAFASKAKCEQADEFMECHTSVYGWVVIVLTHVPVHVLIHEPECEGFIADECLIMAFCVGDVRFSVASVDEGAPDFMEVPVFVSFFFDGFDPEIWDAHGEPVGEADSAFWDRAAESRHTTHIFRDDEGVGLDLLSKVSGELEVEDGVFVDAMAEIFIKVVERNIAVVVVEHGGDAIEAEAIEVEFFEPVADVGEEEFSHLRFAIVEAF